MSIKVGDKVILNPNSRWYSDGRKNPAKTCGVVYEIKQEGYLPIRVRWGRNSSNSYRLEDLIIVNTEEEILAAEMCYGFKIEDGGLSV